jgi:hypothetical protein
MKIVTYGVLIVIPNEINLYLTIVAFLTGVRELQQGKRPAVCMQQRRLEILLFLNCASPKMFLFLLRGVFILIEILVHGEGSFAMAGVAWIPWSITLFTHGVMSDVYYQLSMCRALAQSITLFYQILLFPQLKRRK